MHRSATIRHILVRIQTMLILRGTSIAPHATLAERQVARLFSPGACYYAKKREKCRGDHLTKQTKPSIPRTVVPTANDTSNASRRESHQTKFKIQKDKATKFQFNASVNSKWTPN